MSSKLDAALRNCSVGIIPSEEYLKKSTELGENVVRFLKSKSRDINRHYYGGSLGKCTTIVFSDVDCVLFFNNARPPFGPVIREFAAILRNNAQHLRIIPPSIEEHERNIQMEFEGGYTMDLVPACNFVAPLEITYGLGGEELADKQRRLATNEMNSRNHSVYSGCLAETQLYFMKRQTEFVHRLVRLAKFWHRSIYLGVNKIYGVKPIMELLAVAAGQETERGGSMLASFTAFLTMVENVDQQKLYFEQLPNKSWIARDCNKTNVGLHGRPAAATGYNFIVEPANVYNDFTQSFTQEVKKELNNLKRFARITKQRLVDLQVVGGGLMEVDLISRLFAPQPTNLLGFLAPLLNEIPEYRNLSLQTPSFFIKVSSSTSNDVPNPKRILNRPEIVNSDGEKMIYKMIKPIENYLVVGVYSILGNQTNMSINGTMQAVRSELAKIISADIGGNVEDTEFREGYYVTYVIPAVTRSMKFSVNVSMRWALSQSSRCIVT